MRKAPKPSPHPDLKYTFDAYMWMLLAAMLIVAGVSFLTDKEAPGRIGSEPIKGNSARVVGWGFVAYGSYLGYIILYRAKKSELAQKGFHELKPFDKRITGYRTQFRISWDTYSRGGHGAGTPVFYYRLQVDLKHATLPKFKIYRRDVIGLVAWYLGPGRIGDILTGAEYFDARYRVIGTDKNAIRSMLCPELVEALSKFDKDYPPILTKNGWLRLDNEKLVYKEGPYPKEQKLFTEHRGRIDLIAAELILLATLIDAGEGNES